MKNIDSTMRELAQYTRIMEEAAATVDGLKDEIKKSLLIEKVVEKFKIIQKEYYVDKNPIEIK